MKLEDFQAEVREVVKLAYQNGMADSQTEKLLPYLLTKKDLAMLFQVEESTVNKIVARPGFPKSKFVTARYPREEVLKWVKQNSITVQ